MIGEGSSTPKLRPEMARVESPEAGAFGGCTRDSNGARRYSCCDEACRERYNLNASYCYMNMQYLTETCQHGGACTETEDSQDGFTCSCRAGYEGTRCEVNTDECASAPCKNGAMCTDGVNSHTCTCARRPSAAASRSSSAALILLSTDVKFRL